MNGSRKCVESQTQSPVLIKADSLSVAYDGKKALADVSLAVRKGDFVAVTGPNGGGKSTLLKVLLRLIEPTSGRVSYYKDGQETERLRFGYLPQKSNIDSRYPITVEEVVASGLHGNARNWRGLYAEEAASKIRDVLRMMGVEDCRKQAIGTLSGGQLQRTLLGRAIIANPEIVVLDEPLSYVDRAFVRQIYKIVEDLSVRATVILVSHEMTMISEMANRHWIVDKTLHECHAAHHYLKTECD